MERHGHGIHEAKAAKRGGPQVLVTPCSCESNEQAYDGCHSQCGVANNDRFAIDDYNAFGTQEGHIVGQQVLQDCFRNECRDGRKEGLNKRLAH